MRLSENKKCLIILFFLLLTSGCSHSEKDTPTSNTTMTLSSPAFSNMSFMPVKFAYNDVTILTDIFLNRSPKLEWSGIPSGTQSLVLIAWAPNNENYNLIGDKSVNWVLYMPTSNVTSLEENASADLNLPAGSIQGLNRNGTTGWSGPAPDSSVPYYTYSFEIYALDTLLSLSSTPTKDEVTSAMVGHIIGYGEYFGKYSRMTLSSQVFSNYGFIPVEYACVTGPNYLSDDFINDMNPDLTWTNAPSDTESYVVFLDGQETPTPKSHWIIYNISPTVLSMQKGAPNQRPYPSGITVGSNDFPDMTIDYHGPDPASGLLASYYFRVFALDKVLDQTILGHSNRQTTYSAMQGHILNMAEYSGKFIKLELSSSSFSGSTATGLPLIPYEYGYKGMSESINPQFSWNSSALTEMASFSPKPISLVFLATSETSTGAAGDTNNWCLYIPQVDVYQIPRDISWFTSLFPDNWIQGLTSYSDSAIWWDRGYDGPENYSTTGVDNPYRFELYVLASTLGIAAQDIQNSNYGAFISAMESTASTSTIILNKAFLTGSYSSK